MYIHTYEHTRKIFERAEDLQNSKTKKKYSKQKEEKPERSSKSVI